MTPIRASVCQTSEMLHTTTLSVNQVAGAWIYKRDLGWERAPL